MASKRTHDIVATTGTYTGANGAEKKRYVNVGSGFTDEQGRLSLKLETIPVGPDWSGWLSLYPVKDKDDRESDRRQQDPPPRDPPGTTQPDDEETEIPF